MKKSDFVDYYYYYNGHIPHAQLKFAFEKYDTNNNKLVINEKHIENNRLYVR